MVTSVIDYFFRDLAINYLNRTDLGQVKPEELNETDISPRKNIDIETNEDSKDKVHDTFAESTTHSNTKEKEFIASIKQAWIKGYEGDPCPNCGAFTLIRNGTCMKCDTCGGTTGCS
jgi:ribonucleoside-diphosphate reductase alpha chain